MTECVLYIAECVLYVIESVFSVPMRVFLVFSVTWNVFCLPVKASFCMSLSVSSVSVGECFVCQ